MNWDAKISINTQSEKFHYRNHQSCLLQLLSFLDARRTRGILLLMDTASPKTAPEMATPTTSVPCSLQAEPLESPSTHWPSPWVQRPGVPRQKVLQNPWSLSLPSWRPHRLCLETVLPSHPYWHELLRRLLGLELQPEAFSSATPNGTTTRILSSYSPHPPTSLRVCTTDFTPWWAAPILQSGDFSIAWRRNRT